MMELKPVSEHMQRLSAAERLCLIQTLNALPSSQFDELVFALQPPKGNIPSDTAPQSSRSKALLEWAESPIGPGLLEFEKILNRIITKHSGIAEQFIAFVISGKISSSTTAEIQAFVQLLRKKTGDDSIDVAFFKEGSIKLILSGSVKGLERLQEIFEIGELEALPLPVIEDLSFVENDTADARKARLIHALRLREHYIGNLAISRARNLVHTLNIAYLTAKDIDQIIDIDLARALALTRAQANNLSIFINKTSDFSTALSRAQKIVDDLSFDVDLTRALDRNPGLARNFDRDSRAHVLSLTVDLNQVLELARSLARRLTDSLNQRNIFALNLSGADLTGSYLKNINFTDADLTGTDFTNADVTGAIFGNNLGLTEADKRDLQRRGAIFQEPPRSSVPNLALR